MEIKGIIKPELLLRAKNYILVIHLNRVIRLLNAHVRDCRYSTVCYVFCAWIFMLPRQMIRYYV